MRLMFFLCFFLVFLSFKRPVAIIAPS
jgi:hypothetical protein